MLNKFQILNTFLELIKIDSVSGEEEKVADYIIGYLQGLGIKAKKDHYGNLIAKIEGRDKPLFLAAHMDTVEPGRNIKPIVRGDKIMSDGTTVLGADDKAGITEILEGVRFLKEKKIIHRPLELIFTREEEIGVKGSLNLDYRKIKAREGVVLDACRKIGHVIIASPYIYSIRIKIKGRSAHSGVSPEKGINALLVAVEAISNLKIGRIDKETTNNIGVLKSGMAMNSVPAEVEILAEARSHVLGKVKKQVELFKKAFGAATKKYGAKLEFKAIKECSGYNYSKDDVFIKKISLVNEKLNINTVYEVTGGASDVNIFSGHGLKVVDVAYGGRDMHTVKESINLKELMKMVEWVIEFCKN